MVMQEGLTILRWYLASGSVSAAVLHWAGMQTSSWVCHDASCLSAAMFALKYFTEVAHCQAQRKLGRPLTQFWGFPHTPAPNGLWSVSSQFCFPGPTAPPAARAGVENSRMGWDFPSQGPSTGRAAQEQEGEQMRSVP